MITTLRIRKIYPSKIEMGVKWYGIISVLNNFKWALMDMRVLAFTAIHGDISSGGRKQAFCTLYKSTDQSIANCVSRLYKKGFLIKEHGKTKVHPQLLISFEGEILSQINLKYV
jgi:hypothetical protein